ncbi:MAG: glycosyltransferase family 4 protein [Chloroflexi bacterium]|nr:glycosyltransferase family 4 protein [Chloroflexota bacterium]
MNHNVAFITHSQYPLEVRARRMAEALAADGYGVDVFCLRHAGEAPVESLNGVTIYRLPVMRGQGRGGLSYIWEYLRFFVAAAWQLTRRHVRRRYVLAQVYNPPDLLAFATLLPRLLTGMRVILDVRDMAPELFQSRFRLSAGHIVTRILRTSERWACAYVHAVTVCTEHQFNVQAGRGIPPERMTIVMNTPDDAIFGPLPDLGQPSSNMTAASSADAHSFAVIYHGAILQRYGLDVLIRAIPDLKAEIPALRVDIYGIGDFLPAAQELAATLGVADVTHFHGYVPVVAVGPIIRGADVGVVPMHRDVFTDTILPTKLMEYAYLGVPAVVGRTTTTNEYFEDDMVAFFEASNPQDLARQVMACYRDPAGAAAMAFRARRFTERHNWSRDKAAYLMLVERLIGKH